MPPPGAPGEQLRRGARRLPSVAGLSPPAFGHLDEVWWHSEGEANERGFVVEPAHVFEDRVERFRGWLAERPESMIAVVGHGTFF